MKKTMFLKSSQRESIKWSNTLKQFVGSSCELCEEQLFYRTHPGDCFFFFSLNKNCKSSRIKVNKSSIM